MKILVLIIDLGLLIMFIYNAFFKSYAFYRVPSIVHFPIIILFILNIICIKFDFKNNWLSLYFKRKALEEKKKIDELSSK